MSSIDWVVLSFTLLAIISYGIYKSKTSKNLDGYFLSDRNMPWYLILLSIMGTQASAITFISAPGQAYTDGMRFVQYYFGLPLAMVLLCITFLPVFHKIKIYTAYEFLENRFDSKTRSLTSFLFLLQRGLSTGISIYAPSIILSTLLGWNIYWTNIFMGGLLIIYSVSGGARAIAYTQQLQFFIIFISMFFAGYFIIKLLPENVGFIDALKVGGKLGKLNIITSGIENGKFNFNDRYNIYSGIIGGFFLALSYFGTDQSQVGRYLTAKDIKESRMGLLFNGLVKVPMQFFILLIGVLLFTFYQFNSSPLFFNQTQIIKVENSIYKDSLAIIQNQYNELNLEKTKLVQKFIDQEKNGESSVTVIAALKEANKKTELLRSDFKNILGHKEIGGDKNDTNYVFLRFVIDFLPKGLVGLIIAVIFLASWGSIAAALNSLASCTMIDIHKKFISKNDSELQDYSTSKIYTFVWGIFSIIVAMFSTGMGSLIEAVNILGSLFYGVILGIFLVGFYFKSVNGSIVFWSAVLMELVVVLLFWKSNIGFLWMNVIGALGVVLCCSILMFLSQFVLKSIK
jgi:solute:Na+ symporter, SSS family